MYKHRQTHWLSAEKGQWNHIPLDERIGTLCNINDTDYEFH